MGVIPQWTRRKWPPPGRTPVAVESFFFLSLFIPNIFTLLRGGHETPCLLHAARPHRVSQQTFHPGPLRETLGFIRISRLAHSPLPFGEAAQAAVRPAVLLLFGSGGLPSQPEED